MAKPQVICFTDTETTGLDPYEDEVIQLAAIKVMHHPEDATKVVRLNNCTMEVKIKPTKEVPPEVAKLNGYDPEVWEKEAISREEAMQQFSDFVQWTNFGGQNPAFDKGFLLQEFKKCGLQWPRMQGYRLIATEMLAWPLLLAGKIPNVKQETLVRYFGIGEQTHDALNDVEQCVEIYSRLIGAHVARALAED